jgi:hypothetical protein
MNRRPAVRCIAALLLAIAFVGTGCDQPPSPLPPVPADWQTLDAAGIFTFRAPLDLQQVPVQGVDSIVGHYASPTLDVGFDVGTYSDPMDREGYVQRRVRVDGRRARLVTKDNVVAIRFPGSDGKAKLTMSVRVNGADPKVAEAMLLSIDFP